MKQPKDLVSLIKTMDGKGYKAYKALKDTYDFGAYVLIIDHVQGDPFALASRVRVRIDRSQSGFQRETTSNLSRTIALCDFLTRAFCDVAKTVAKPGRGSGKSGMIIMDTPLQEILQRSSIVIDDACLEARFFMGLPAFGRKIAGKIAQAMFMKELPEIVRHSLFMGAFDRKNVFAHLETSEDADSLRHQLTQLGLVGFVAEGAILPRQSGIDPSPMDRESAIPFRSPDAYRVSVTLPNRGMITGMGIPKGITLIVGGGYHGKSTLLNALELGVYNHIPGDGREMTVSLKETLKVRAEDGRNIEQTDISPFISNLPFQKDTTAFSTKNASGSTSQAAAISEGIEAGATVLLLDEDTSATNFMIRDHLMQALVMKQDEPITPFIDKVTHLFDERQISTIIVIGGSGEYFHVANHVIQMKEYQPMDVTEKARQIMANSPVKRIEENRGTFGTIARRIPDQKSFDPARKDGKTKIAAIGLRGIEFGRDFIDISGVEQLVETSQLRAIGYAIHLAASFMDGKRTIQEVLHCVMDTVKKRGLDSLTPYITGDLAGFRDLDLASAINRSRRLLIHQKINP